jgi:YjbE family integral membrane protein
MDFLTFAAAEAFLTVVMIDLVLAGDNAVVIGLAAAGLPAHQRGKAILIGVIAATVLRILFALVASQLLAIIGLLFAGGVLLLWVCWKMWRELRQPHADQKEAIEGQDINKDGMIARQLPVKSLGSAVSQIVVADVSMSLDNVLAVAGAAHDHPWILVFGLALSVLLMGVAATFIARLLHKHRWIAYVGLLIILWVSLQMMFEGGVQIYDCNPAWFNNGTQLGPHCPFAPGGPAAALPH